MRRHPGSPWFTPADAARDEVEDGGLTILAILSAADQEAAGRVLRFGVESAFLLDAFIKLLRNDAARHA